MSFLVRHGKKVLRRWAGRLGLAIGLLGPILLYYSFGDRSQDSGQARTYVVALSVICGITFGLVAEALAGRLKD